MIEIAVTQVGKYMRFISKLEWEGLQKKHEIKVKAVSELLPPGTEKVEIYRDDAYIALLRQVRYIFRAKTITGQGLTVPRQSRKRYNYTRLCDCDTSGESKSLRILQLYNRRISPTSKGQ